VFGNPGQLSQFAIAERRVRGGDGTQHSQAASEGGHFVAGAVFVFGRGHGGSGRRGSIHVFFWNFISVLFFAGLPELSLNTPATAPGRGIAVIFHRKIHCIGIFSRNE
jgi:hypothetical protein